MSRGFYDDENENENGSKSRPVSDNVTFRYRDIIRDTGKASLFIIVVKHEKDDDEEREVWLPNSVFTLYPASRIVSMPRKWAIEKELI